MNILYDKIKLLSQQHGHRLREVNNDYDPLSDLLNEEDDELLGWRGGSQTVRRWSVNRKTRAMTKRVFIQSEGAANSSGLDVSHFLIILNR